MLTKWQHRTSEALYRRRPWGVQCLLPDVVLGAIASKAHVRSVDDLVTEAGWDSSFAEQHGIEVLGILTAFDRTFREHQVAEKQVKMVKKKRETAARQAAKLEAKKVERIRLKTEQENHPKKPRASRAKKCLSGSTAHNLSLVITAVPSTPAPNSAREFEKIHPNLASTSVSPAAHFPPLHYSSYSFPATPSIASTHFNPHYPTRPPDNSGSFWWQHNPEYGCPEPTYQPHNCAPGVCQRHPIPCSHTRHGPTCLSTRTPQ